MEPVSLNALKASFPTPLLLHAICATLPAKLAAGLLLFVLHVINYFSATMPAYLYVLQKSSLTTPLLHVIPATYLVTLA